MYIFMFMSGYVAYVADENTLKKKILKRLPTYLRRRSCSAGWRSR